MHTLQEIETIIRCEVAKCKGVAPDAIPTDSPLFKVVGLHGDDFIAVAAYIHRECKVRPRKDAYGAGLTVSEWARIVHESEASLSR